MHIEIQHSLWFSSTGWNRRKSLSIHHQISILECRQGHPGQPSESSCQETREEELHFQRKTSGEGLLRPLGQTKSRGTEEASVQSDRSSAGHLGLPSSRTLGCETAHQVAHLRWVWHSEKTKKQNNLSSVLFLKRRNNGLWIYMPNCKKLFRD